MKKQNIITSIFEAIFILLTSLLAACTDGEKQYVIGVSQPCDDAWRQRMNEEMRRELLFHPNITLEVRNSEYNNAQQTADIEYFMRRGVDLIVVCPNEAEALDAAVTAAYKSGIPVIVADRNVVSNNYTAFISGDNTSVSEMLGNYVLENMPEGGKVLELLGLPDASPAVQRHGKFAEMITNAGCYELTSIHADWQWEKAETVMDSLLSAGYIPDMVVAQNDQMAQGAHAAADKFFAISTIYINNVEEKPEIRFIGVDGMQGEGNGINAIVEGRLEASFIYPPGGDEIVRLAVKILNGEPFDRVTILPSALVDRHNAEVLQMHASQIDHEVETIDMLSRRVDYFWQQHNLERTLLYTLLILFGLVLLFIFFLYRNYYFKKRANERLERQKKILNEKNEELRKLSKQVEEATRAKLMFFTNVSHDFRTPLTLISAPLEKLQEEVKDIKPHHKQLLGLAQKNVHVLLRLVNQILDFRKYESGKLELHLTSVNLSEAVQNWFESFKGLAFKRHIKLELNIEEPVAPIEPNDSPFLTQLDVQKIERVFFNIIGNAFKFTPENGTIRVRMWRENENIKLSIADSGDGIMVEHIQHIFDNFYQVDSAHHEGSGIGLAVVKSFVEMHGGKITASNAEEGGAIFTITLPIRKAEKEILNSQFSTLNSTQVQTELAVIDDVEEITEDEPLPVALIIDDNADVRQMMRTLLADKYKVVTARDGQDGLRKAMKIVPNVVVCDVMMPVMDGLECCRRLKAEMTTSHIPVLLLTACSLDEQRVQGHNVGADAYLAKPFSAQVLIAQLDALVQNHDRVRDFFGSLTPTLSLKGEGEKKIESISDVNNATNYSSPSPFRERAGVRGEAPDETFLRKLRAIIDKNLEDSDFSVEQLGDEICMSRAQLYRKVKALTNYSPVELIRNSRLKRGRQLLAQGSMTIAQVAYEVGFTAPSYFSKCYKDYFGEMPNELLK